MPRSRVPRSRRVLWARRPAVPSTATSAVLLRRCSTGSDAPTPPDSPAPPKAAKSGYEFGLADESDHSFGDDEASSFWALPAVPAPADGPAAPDEYLSGNDDSFDATTGWDFAAISSSSLPAALEEEAGFARTEAVPPPLPRSTPPDPELDLAGTSLEIIDSGEFASMDELLGRVGELLAADRTEEAAGLLEQAETLAPGDPMVATWAAFALRKLVAVHCPDGALDGIPELSHPAAKLLPVATPAQQRLIMVVDGRRTAGDLQAAVDGMTASRFWRELGKLQRRGWVRWKST